MEWSSPWVWLAGFTILTALVVSHIRYKVRDCRAEVHAGPCMPSAPANCTHQTRKRNDAADSAVAEGAVQAPMSSCAVAPLWHLHKLCWPLAGCQGQGCFTEHSFTSAAALSAGNHKSMDSRGERDLWCVWHLMHCQWAEMCLEDCTTLQRPLASCRAKSRSCTRRFGGHVQTMGCALMWLAPDNALSSMQDGSTHC